VANAMPDQPAHAPIAPKPAASYCEPVAQQNQTCNGCEPVALHASQYNLTREVHIQAQPANNGCEPVAQHLCTNGYDAHTRTHTHTCSPNAGANITNVLWQSCQSSSMSRIASEERHQDGNQHGPPQFCIKVGINTSPDMRINKGLSHLCYISFH